MASSSSLSAPATILFLFTGGLIMSHLSTPASANNRLNSGESLHAFESLSSGQYYFIMHKFCYLVFEEGNKLIWEAQGQGVFCTLTMQADGNLVMREGTTTDGNVVWASNTNQPNPNNYYLLVTNQVAIYDNENNAIWVNGNKLVR